LETPVNAVELQGWLWLSDHDGIRTETLVPEAFQDFNILYIASAAQRKKTQSNQNRD
jgi:hypothetical protein